VWGGEGEGVVWGGGRGGGVSWGGGGWVWGGGGVIVQRAPHGCFAGAMER